jgi:hypothetical protein
VKKWEACIWKRAYDSEADALANGQEAYFCVYCSKWHCRMPIAAKQRQGAKRHERIFRAKAMERARRAA